MLNERSSCEALEDREYSSDSLVDVVYPVLEFNPCGWLAFLGIGTSSSFDHPEIGTVEGMSIEGTCPGVEPDEWMDETVLVLDSCLAWRGRGIPGCNDAGGEGALVRDGDPRRLRGVFPGTSDPPFNGV